MNYELCTYVLKRVTIDDNECWNWTKGLNQSGYGTVGTTAKWYTKYGRCLASQLAYIAWKGDYPKKLYVLHECNNPRCCNPKHLYLAPYSSGTKLSKIELEAIKALLNKMPNKDIAKLFNVSEATIVKIESSAYLS